MRCGALKLKKGVRLILNIKEFSGGELRGEWGVTSDLEESGFSWKHCSVSAVYLSTEGDLMCEEARGAPPRTAALVGTPGAFACDFT